jgi:hypothetical protein
LQEIEGIDMDEIFAVIKQDLEVAKKGVDTDYLDILTPVGNRIMMSLLVNDEIKLMLLGYMIKELRNEMRNIKLNHNDAYLLINQK